MTDMTVAFPDEGAFKRFHLMFEQEFPLITCIKIREGGNRIIKIKEGKIFSVFCRFRKQSLANREINAK